MGYDYDIVILGGGSAGLVSSKLAQGLGKKVAIIEKERLGGECTWTGCVPSKTIIKSAYVAHIFKQLDQFGFALSGQATLDTSGVLDHVRNVIYEIYETHTPKKLRELGIDVIKGSPSFIDRHHLKADGKTISFNKAIIATGSKPFIPPIEGVNDVPYLTNENIFLLEKLPSSLIILGGGAIGCEMASALNRLGVKVTIVEMQDHLLVKEDAELVEQLTAIFKDEGITIRTSLTARTVRYENGSIVVTCENINGQEDLYAEAWLIAVGRRANVEGLNLDKIGIIYDNRRIHIDALLRTTVTNIYACGDVVGPYLFSHMAFHQAALATRNALLPFSSKINYDHVVWVTFTDPELASAGLTEEQAREKYGNSIKVFRRAYEKIDRAHTQRDTRGMCKIICDKQGHIIGAQVLGAHAGDIVHELQVMKYFGKKLHTLYHVIHAYPTYSEIIWHIAKEAYIERLRNHVLIRFLQKIRSWIPGAS